MARNLYMTGIEELEASLLALPDVDVNMVLTVKRTIVSLLHQDESGSIPYRRFGRRTIDSNRRAMRVAVRGELGTTNEAVQQITNALFEDPTPQYDAMTRMLEHYRNFVEGDVGTDSDSE